MAALNKIVHLVFSQTKEGSWDVPWKSVNMIWLLLLLVLIHCNVVQPFPVFTFNGTSPTSTPTPSYAHLVNDLDLREKFILCTSVKQARFDDVGFYVISGKDSDEWLTTQISTYLDETWLTMWWDQSRYELGKLHDPMLDSWYHVCLKINSKKIVSYIPATACKN